MLTIGEMRVGDRVIFGRRRGEKTLGEVVKVNKRNLKVKQLEERGVSRRRPPGTIWTVPPALCERADGPRATDAGPSAPLPRRPKRSEEQVMTQIRAIYCRLSPENLTCDGELSRREVDRRYARLQRDLRDCFKELGRRVTEDEAFNTARKTA